MLIGFGISPSRVKVTGGAVAFDPDAETFFTAASITDSTQKSAVNQLVLDLKSYNIWTKMKALYPICGGSASSHAVNLKTPGTYNLTFSTGWTHSSTGMTPNGTSAYADTSLIPSSILTQNSTHVSFYSRTTSNGTEVEIGSVTALGDYPAIQLEIRTSGITYANINAGTFITASDSDSKGYYISSRTASNAIKLYKNNTTLASGTTASTGRPNNQLSIGAQRYSAGVVYYSTKQCAFASIGDGLTDTEAANFYTAVQAYQTTLSRQV